MNRVPRPGTLVDLSRPLVPAAGIYPGDPGVEIESAAAHASHGYAVCSVRMSSHSGTHVDAPFHFLPGEATLDAFAIDRFVGAAVILDVRAAGPGAAVSQGLLEDSLRSAGGLGDARLVLLWTGWDTRYGAPDMMDHPHLSPDAADLLVELGVTLVGTDAANIDSSMGDSYPVHPLLLGAGVLVVENLANLGRLGEGKAFCALLPLALVGTDGAPVRAVGWRMD
jgi:kynurenine formamidase